MEICFSEHESVGVFICTNVSCSSRTLVWVIKLSTYAFIHVVLLHGDYSQCYQNTIFAFVQFEEVATKRLPGTFLITMHHEFIVKIASVLSIDFIRGEDVHGFVENKSSMSSQTLTYPILRATWWFVRMEA